MKKKQYTVYFLILFVMHSCKIMNDVESRKFNNKELIKQLAFCNCLEYSFHNENRKDTLDNSIQWLNGMLIDRFPKIYFQRIKSTIDSLAKNEYIMSEKTRHPNQPVAEGSYGKASYTIDCLNFYKSGKLDSIVGVMVKESKSNSTLQQTSNF